MSSAAHAVLTLSLNNGGASTIITDDDGDGILSTNAALSVFDVNMSTVFSKPLLVGEPTVIDLSSINTSSAAGRLTIEVTETDFLFPSSYLNFGIDGTINGEIAYEAFVSLTNDDNPFLGTLIGSGDASILVNTKTFSDARRLGLSLDGTEPYSLGIRITIDHDAGRRVTSFNSEIRVPEPGSLVYWEPACCSQGFCSIDVSKGAKNKDPTFFQLYLGFMTAIFLKGPPSFFCSTSLQANRARRPLAAPFKTRQTCSSGP